MTCDLMERASSAALPDAESDLYLVGLKFGTRDNPALTWAVNTLIPAAVAERYTGSRIVALSTGNVYPLVAAPGAGAAESHALTPLGEYANACVARERIFQYASERYGTPGVLVRLNYAVDLRYGVLVDLARKVWSGTPVDVTMGYLNCIWQRDANDMIVRALGLAGLPMRPLNLTGLEALSVRALAQQLGGLMGKTVEITGAEAPTALLSDASAAAEARGAPPMPLETMLRWTAAWIMHDYPTLDKPTSYHVRDGRY
jgi:nucleoside-diphosphate-sugar epimerase